MLNLKMDIKIEINSKFLGFQTSSVKGFAWRPIIKKSMLVIGSWKFYWGDEAKLRRI